MLPHTCHHQINRSVKLIRNTILCFIETNIMYKATQACYNKARRHANTMISIWGAGDRKRKCYFLWKNWVERVVVTHWAWACVSFAQLLSTGLWVYSKAISVDATGFGRSLKLTRDPNVENIMNLFYNSEATRPVLSLFIYLENLNNNNVYLKLLRN